MRRKSLRLLVIAAIPALVLAGACGGTQEPAPNSTASGLPSGAASPTESAELAGVNVQTGEKDATMTLPSVPFSASAGYRVVHEGTGEPIGADQVVTANILVVNGKDGKQLESSYGKTPAELNLTEASLLPDIKAALIGRPIGSQVMVATKAAADQAEAGIATGDTLVFYFDLAAARTPLKQAEGTPVAPKAGLPAVTMGATERDPATFTLPSGNPPKTTVAQPLIIGNGAKVASGQRVRVTYTGVTWRDPSTPFDYSGRQPTGYAEFDVGRGQLIKAWDEKLVGQPIGSRLLLIVPPADGYGPKGQGDIKGTDTLIFVLDILDAR